MPSDEPSSASLTGPHGLVVVGASHCGIQSAFAARRQGFSGPITVLGEESELPYHRPPLSKDALTGSRSTSSNALRPQSAYDKADIKLRLGVTVSHVDRERRQVHTQDGEVIGYSRLLLATGARARTLRVPGSELSGIYTLRSSLDAARIRDAASAGSRVAIVGGGYIGLETAASLSKFGLHVTVLEAMPRLLQRVASHELSDFYRRIHDEAGVDVRVGAYVKGFEGEGSVKSVLLDGAEAVTADLVVVGIGVIPNDELAAKAGLATENGIVVNAQARTEDEHIYAAGDCANGYNALYQRHLRLESIQHANDQGKVAVNAMLGTASDYNALPWFWSDQYDVKLQIAGLIDEGGQVVVRGDPLNSRAFSLCHVKGDVLVAVEAVNTPRDFLTSKALIVSQSRMDLDRLKDHEQPLAECVLAE